MHSRRWNVHQSDELYSDRLMSWTHIRLSVISKVDKHRLQLYGYIWDGYMDIQNVIAYITSVSFINALLHDTAIYVQVFHRR